MNDLNKYSNEELKKELKKINIDVDALGIDNYFRYWFYCEVFFDNKTK